MIAIDSHSPWGFANVLTLKKGAKPGEFMSRMYTNFRPLNDITRKDAYPLPRIDDILDTLKGNPEYFSGLDLFSGYYQIGLTPQAQERAAFVTHRGHYEYTRMPFGMCNAPATFQRMMNNILKEQIGKTLLVYLDDVMIFTKTFEQHMQA